MDIKAYVKEFAESLASRKYSPATVASRRQSLGLFAAFLDAAGITRLQDASADVLERYRQKALGSGLSPNTVENYMHAIRGLFDFLEAGGAIFENPARKMAMRKQAKVLGGVLTEDEARRLLAAPDCSRKVGLRDRAMLELLYGTGIRGGELMRLTVFDVDIERQTVRVAGKGGKERVLPIGKNAARHLESYLRHSRTRLAGKAAPGSDALWLGIFHEAIREQSARVVIKRHARKAGISKQVSTHTLRRTCATHMLRNGAHPAMVAEMLGHAGMQTLSHYLQVSIADLMRTHAATKPGA